MANKSQLWVALFDLHFPKIHKPTLAALTHFIKENPIEGFIFGGDNFDNQEKSRHTRHKPLLREQGAYLRNIKKFDEQILTPLEALLPAKAKRIWLDGNHEAWSDQHIEENPEDDGMQHREQLDLAKRGWELVPQGGRYRLGKLRVIHGDTLSGIGNQVPGDPAKKAVNAYASSVLFGHFHTLQAYSRVLPDDQTQRWAAFCSPCAADVKQPYLKKKPTNWVNGFTIVESWDGGRFNVYQAVISANRFSFAGKIYGQTSKN